MFISCYTVVSLIFFLKQSVLQFHYTLLENSPVEWHFIHVKSVVIHFFLFSDMSFWDISSCNTFPARYPSEAFCPVYSLSDETFFYGEVIFDKLFHKKTLVIILKEICIVFKLAHKINACSMKNHGVTNFSFIFTSIVFFLGWSF